MHSSVGKSVVVVGNGVSVIGSALGEQIDAFDEVARFNHFVIRGYEQDVGTKTTIMVMAQIKVRLPLAHPPCVHTATHKSTAVASPSS
jgi:hypothetical protein